MLGKYNERRSIIGGALVAGTVFAVPAQASSTIEVGTLTCVGGEGVGLILGSQKSYDCRFKPITGEPPEPYRATVTRIGLDIGVTGPSVMVWRVFAPSDALDDRALAGRYGGVAADAAVGVGGGAKALVGGSDETISLQPLSVQGQTGVNLAVGVAALTLR